MSSESPSVRAEHRREVTREHIVSAALALADAEGFDAVSMRRVAAELGLGTMTLYHYVAGKQELLYLMADAVVGEMLVPGEFPVTWRSALRAIAERTRDTFVRHPWLFETAGRRPLATPNLLRHIEQSAAAVATLELDQATATAMLLAVDDYTIGYVIRQAARGRGGDPDNEMRLSPELLARVEAGEFPILERVFAAGKKLELPPGRFEVGLEWLLDGMEVMLAARGRGSGE